METLAIFAVFLPLLGFLTGSFLKPLYSQWTTCTLMGGTTLFSLLLLLFLDPTKEPLLIPLFQWIRVEFLDVSWGIQLDRLSLLMMALVTTVSLLVHVYSIGYMKGDPSLPRFMGYLSFFTFCMLVLVTSPNFLQLFFGWEGVGLCSYLLIGYWYDRDKANAAAFKAFIINRIGDAGFILGILTLFVIFGTIDFSAIFSLVEEHQLDTFVFLGRSYPALSLACFLLFLGAMGKSAQIGLHTWLPDAMEGPTPVSALIHAATMVTAGVFLVVRISPLLEYAPFTREFITCVGAITALMGATIACVQNDIKRIIAYSTCSQLGYMFMAAGLSGYSAAMFHLTTHAFFKALLFLGAGSIIHAMSDEHDIRKMGGIWREVPVTYTLMWIGSLSLIGLPFFSGFYSKDIILAIDWVSLLPISKVAFTLGLSAAFLTAFYMLRLLLLVFHGKPHANEAVMGHIHEAPLIMLIPLIILGTFSVFSGYGLYNLLTGEETSFWGSSIFVLPEDNLLPAAHQVGTWVAWSPVLVALLGAGFTYIIYTKEWVTKLASLFHFLYTFLVQQWYFDKLYRTIFIIPCLKLSNLLWTRVDQDTLDGLGPNGLAALSLSGGRLLCRLQTGRLYHYALALVLGFLLMGGYLYTQDTLEKAFALLARSWQSAF